MGFALSSSVAYAKSYAYSVWGMQVSDARLSRKTKGENKTVKKSYAPYARSIIKSAL